MPEKTSQDGNDGHRQRLRQRFLEKGIDALTDSDVIELLLSLGTPRKDCKKPAREALKTLGSLQNVLEADPEELRKINGIGPINSFAVNFIQAVAGRYLKERITEREYLSSSSNVADYLVHTMRGLKKEVLNVIFLDASHRIIVSEIIAEGTLTTNTIYPRELVKKALQHHAAAIIIAHNHPSGSRTPSKDDINLTQHLFLACSMVNINLLDHLIIGSGERPYSFADHGLMARIRADCREVATNG